MSEVIIAEIEKLHGNSYWGRRIRAAVRRGRFTGTNLWRAGCWTTCACGRQDPRIPRQRDGEPVDSLLSDFGMGFYNAVRTNDFDAAWRSLYDIELRSAQLLEDMKCSTTTTN